MAQIGFLLQKSIGLAGTFCIFGRKYLCVKFVTKTCKFLPTFRVSLKISGKPGSLAPKNIPP